MFLQYYGEQWLRWESEIGGIRRRNIDGLKRDTDSYVTIIWVDTDKGFYEYKSWVIKLIKLYI